MGKDAQSFDETKHTPAVLGSALNHFEKNKHVNEKLVLIDDDCINRLDQLERSFAEKSRGKKKTLDDMIARASEKKKTSEKTNEHVPQHGR